MVEKNVRVCIIRVVINYVNVIIWDNNMLRERNCFNLMNNFVVSEWCGMKNMIILIYFLLLSFFSSKIMNEKVIVLFVIRVGVMVGCRLCWLNVRFDL